ncbi:MFS transporter [Bartonella apis]|uniref:Putative arabinose efflux permease, MFS family n=1 Tax=Bartonella apis TaxID=1686310 RepID=A0A1R0F8Y4_9HYPH|nr:MFS transporter [Bartonella apis]MCT6824937.1 MFS transporter [Bartonella apis]MCT6861600.1 MFS transporter [Bartonella apis]OLY43389.1 putative arabinose efflux permease, MFS family [Bartonella apis]OLY48117.1 putative arabinose efflux permease, MFS family [Bartonella apis]
MKSARNLNGDDIRTLGLASLGGALEFYDFIIFVFFTAEISHTVLPSEMSPWLATTWTYGIFAAGYLMRPIGGVVMAHLGDKLGRKRIFTFSVLLMSLATLGMAFVPTYNHFGILSPLILLACRMMQGLAVGGEVPGAWTFVAEHVPERHVGLSTGVLTSGLSLGILIGSFIAFAINHIVHNNVLPWPENVTDFWGWRVAFIIGGIFGLIAVWLRRFLEETPIFKELKRKKALSKEIPLKVVLTKYLGSVVVAVLLTWTLSATIMISTLLTPNYMKAAPYYYSGDVTLAANSITSFFLILGTPVAGFLCDRFGSGKFFTFSGIVFAVISYVFYHCAGYSTGVFFVLSAFLGFFAGYVGSVAYVIVRSFPATVRFSGLSFSYNIAYAVFGGLTPWAINLMQPVFPMFHMWYLIIISLLASLVGLYLIFFGEKKQMPIGIEELETKDL